MTALFTSHWRSALLEDVDAQLVAISRGVPRWSLPFRYRKVSELAPDAATWALEDLEAFERSYLRQLEEIGPRAILERLEALSGGRPVCLLCWERPTEAYCHRWTFARYLHEETGLVVPELSAGDLPLRPDAPQPSLFD